MILMYLIISNYNLHVKDQVDFILILIWIQM